MRRPIFKLSYLFFRQSSRRFYKIRQKRWGIEGNLVEFCPYLRYLFLFLKKERSYNQGSTSIRKGADHMKNGGTMTREITDQEGRTRFFQYALLDEEREGRYGVSVTEKGGETCCLSGLTDSRECAAAFLTLLIRGSVGPVGLPDVAEEWKKARHPY